MLQVQWPLVGRDAEVRQITALLADPSAAYEKLGVAGRGDLADALARAGY